MLDGAPLKKTSRTAPEASRSPHDAASRRPSTAGGARGIPNRSPNILMGLRSRILSCVPHACLHMLQADSQFSGAGGRAHRFVHWSLFLTKVCPLAHTRHCRRTRRDPAPQQPHGTFGSNPSPDLISAAFCPPRSAGFLPISLLRSSPLVKRASVLSLKTQLHSS